MVQEEASEVQCNVTCYCIGGNPIACNSSSALAQQNKPNIYTNQEYKKQEIAFVSMTNKNEGPNWKHTTYGTRKTLLKDGRDGGYGVLNSELSADSTKPYAVIG